MAKRRAKRKATSKRCPYRTTFSILLCLYIIFMLYSMVTNTPLPAPVMNVYSHIMMRVFVVVATVLLILRGDYLQAVLLVAAYLLTYLAADHTIEGFKDALREEKHEEEEEHEEEMLDYADFADTPVGKAYNPKENYISGIYDFTGHLKYDQLPVVPP